MPSQIKQAKLREEFISLFDNPLKINEQPPSAYEIADWWLAKVSQAKLETLEAIIKEVKGMKDRRYYEDITHADEELKVIQARSMEIGHNRALSDLLIKLQTSLTLLKNEK